jgi:flagellar assembly protein FliH
LARSLPAEPLIVSTSNEEQQRLEERLQQAYAQGRAAGQQEGAAEASRRLDPAIQSFQAAVEQLAQMRARLRRESERDLIQLALAIARRILHRELSLDPAALEGIASAALARLEARELHRIRVAPQSARVLQQFRERLRLPARVEIVEDSGLPPGSILFETTRGELDASVDTQLAEIERGLTDLVERA